MKNTRLDFFLSIKNPVIATLYTQTKVKMNKTGNLYYDRVTKQSRVNVVIGPDYESCVNKQADREEIPADFKAAPRTWGMRIKGCPLVTHKDETYVEAMILRSLGHTYYIDGKEATPSQIEYIEAKLGVKSEGNRQPTEKKVIWRDYKLSSINAIKVGGVFTDFMAVPATPKKKVVTRTRLVTA